MGKKYLAIIFAAVIIFLSFSIVQNISAHTEEMDGAISAMLHITPDDNPAAGSESNIIIEFHDSANTFRSSECGCRISIVKEGREVFGRALFSKLHEEDTMSADLEYVFPEKGIYQLIISGEPHDGHGAFKPFKLTFDTRVDREVSQTGNTNFFIICIVCMLFLLLVGALIYKIAKK